MNKSFPMLSIFVAVALFAAAFGALVVQSRLPARAAPDEAAYETVLGRSLHDKDVADFIARNGCSGAGQFKTCRAAGMALWIDASQNVDTVYLYPSQTGGFGSYKGKLPLGLSRRDTRTSVEHKLGQPRVEHAPQAGWELGLPDESSTPDPAYSWALYDRFGLTIIYSSPSSADQGAAIYAILIHK